MTKYLINYNLDGGAGAPITFSTGSNFLTLSSYNILMKLYNILDTEQYRYMSKIKDMIYKFNTKISDFNSNYIINVTEKQLKVIKYLLKNI